jgi:hypothetical protein
LSEIKKYDFNDLIFEPGWGYYIKLPNDWCLGFDVSIPKNGINENDKVKYIFKRK